VANRVMARLDRVQQRWRPVAIAYAVVKKFGDDEANLLVVALGWYGFTAIYPLLLVVVAVLGYVGAGSLGTGVVRTLHQFPVIGSQFNPGPGGSNLHGSAVGLVIGVVGLLYGAQGVTQSAQQAMAQVWNVPPSERPGFASRLARSLGGLTAIGAAFIFNAFAASFAAAHGRSVTEQAALIVGLLVINIGFYLVTFTILTTAEVTTRQLFPGSVTGGLAFTALITIGAGLIQHQLRNSSAVYGALSAVIGVVTFLLLLAKLSIYSAELNTVLARRLWPRSLQSSLQVAGAAARERDEPERPLS
jgi:uncharacterized BrkB/YihY/UPF0761 family membrane protein